MKKHLKLYLIILLIFLLSLSSCNKTEDKINGEIKEPLNNVGEEPSTSNTENDIAILASEDNIDEENLILLVEELTSEKYAGRLAGTEGNELATQFIANKFKEIGLESPQGIDNYLQDFNINCLTFDEAPIMQLEDKDGNVIKSFKFAEDFVIRQYTAAKNLDIKAPLYLVKGSETVSTANSNAKDKILLFPLSRKTNPTLYIDATSSLAGIVEDDIESASRYYSKLPVAPLFNDSFDSQYNEPLLFVDKDTFTELKEAAEQELILHIIFNFTVDRDKKVSNVIGVIPGSDPVLKDEYIIIGAHFDHVGDNKNGTYNPGALDNASGTASLLEIARVIKSSNITPKKTIIFIAFNGEENGLVGSEYYANNPIYPLDKAVMINLDMVGSSSDIALTIASVNNVKTKLLNDIIECAQELNINYIPSNDGGSDHQSFSRVGVDAILLINADLLSGYHSYDDTVEDVDKFKMEQIVKLVLHYIDKTTNTIEKE